MNRMSLVLLATVLSLLVSFSTFAAELVSVEEAQSRAMSGELLLVDIRTPGEWQETGVPASAVPITMHKPTFLAKLDAAMDGRKDKPVGLICAVGGRSGFLSKLLEERGYTYVVDVSEGMHGSERGAGWLAKGLPTVPYAGE